MKQSQSNVWLFQANPKFYNLAEDLKEMGIGSEDSWTVTRYRDRLQSGDPVILWQSGKHRGIYALGELIGEPAPLNQEPDEQDVEGRPYLAAEYWVPFRYTVILDQPILADQLKSHPVLSNLMVLRAPTGTNFAVTEEQWSALQTLLPVPASRSVTSDRSRSYGHFDPWREKSRKCKYCGWQGKAGECRVGEFYQDLVGMECPQCGEEQFVLTAITSEEVLENWDRMTDTQQQEHASFRRHHLDFKAQALTTPEQLPELDGDRLVLTWDYQPPPGETAPKTLIKHGDRVIWVETTFYEGFLRFEEVAGILQLRYGTRLHDLVPTPDSERMLYGDTSLSIGSVARVRTALQQASTTNGSGTRENSDGEFIR